MSERDVFERRLEAAVRGYVESAPTQVNAARLTDSLATDVPRTRRLVPRPAFRLPNLGFAWILVAAALLALMGMGLIASGVLRNVHLPISTPAPTHALQTAPAVIATPEAPTAPPSPTASPPTSPSPSASPPAAPPIGIVLPDSWRSDQARFEDALDAAGLEGRILVSPDSATEKADVGALIRQGIKVLILCPQDSAAAAAVADEARAAGVKVISNDRLIRNTASVDHYVTFDSRAVGAAQAQYLVDRAASTRGNNLYLYAGAATDNNSYLFLEGAWETLQPMIVDGTFVVRNSSLAAALKAKPTLTRDELSGIIDQVTTNWDANVARALAAGNLATARKADKGTVFVLAPNDTTARAIVDALAADQAVTRAYVTGQDADRESVQAIIDGSQSMTVFKNPRTRVEAVVAAAAAFLEGGAPTVNTIVGNGTIDVPSMLLASVTVTRDSIQAALIDQGYYRASDFTGSWPGKP